MADLETLAATKRTHAEGAAPATPSAGQVVIYAKTDGLMYQKDDAGAETSLAASGGAVATDAIWDAKGDLAGGTGANTAAKLTVGADDTVLTADSAQATGMKWAAGGSSAFVGAFVFNNGSQSISDVTVTALTFDSEVYDTDGFHSTVTNTSRMTIPVGKAGYYRLTGMTGNHAAASTDDRIRFAKNGTDYPVAQFRVPGLASTTGFGYTSDPVYLAEGDYVEAQVYHNSGGAANFGAAASATDMRSASTFSIEFLGT